MQDLDYLLAKATESLTKAQESHISIKEKDVAEDEPENLYFNSLNSKGLVLLRETLKPALKPLQSRKQSEKKEKTAGPEWFNMPAMEITDEIKKDLHIIKNRGVLDPKRHYRKEKLGGSPFIQIGTVIQGPTEYYSSRLQRKERRENIVQELLADAEANSYFKKKYLEIQDKKSRFTKRKLGYKRKGMRS